MTAMRATSILGRKATRALPAVLLLLAMAGWTGTRFRSTAGPEPAVIHQLRIYEIFDGNKAAFHERFRDHAARIMARHDFTIVAMWETRGGDRTEFVYLLEWPDRETMQDRWARFLADPEWIEIKQATSRIHGQVVGEIQDRALAPTPYSPRQSFAR